MPIVAGFLVLITIIASKFSGLENFKNVKPVIFLVLLIFFTFSAQKNIKAVFANQMNCRDEARETYKIILEKQINNRKIHADPYIAFEFRKANVYTDWFPNINKTLKSDMSVLALSKNYYSRYLSDGEPSEYTKHDAPTWKEQREFYKLFADKDSATDPYGNKWLKIYSNKCGTEVWNKN